ncbi:hypothetical protein [Pseudoalteromonas sp. NGC95]|uniref:hypothetical protein n=1 Tax=Pseudoalteromonas sp. NGC95 TaxID=2792051 RepID=UPI0018CE16E9|nr:hypothetical protein [Pseudoalteromonas sp. NGC95]MBH0017904.1 hypothetical protein [Pseudoalteromonas sp. NGC95]
MLFQITIMFVAGGLLHFLINEKKYTSKNSFYRSLLSRAIVGLLVSMLLHTDFEVFNLSINDEMRPKEQLTLFSMCMIAGYSVDFVIKKLVLIFTTQASTS